MNDSLKLLVKDARETENDARNAMNSLVPVGKTNRYQWMPKAPGEKSGVLD